MTHRPLHEIAADIRRTWPNTYFAAKPYLAALLGISKLTDRYIAETGRDIVLGFLGNSSTWRGEDARRIKAELRDILNA
jgi:hypothetical protein